MTETITAILIFCGGAAVGHYAGYYCGRWTIMETWILELKKERLRHGPD